MFPLPLAGLAAAAGAAMFSRNKNNPSASGRQFKPNRDLTRKNYRQVKPLKLNNPLLPILDNLRSTVTQVFKKPAAPDYHSILKDLLPSEAIILKPQFPEGSKQYLVTDIDGDSSNELITSYRLGKEVKTAVFKQQYGGWINTIEISHPSNSTIHYMGTANLSEDERKQLLIGIREGDEFPSLSGYSIDNHSIFTLFNRPYQRFELINGRYENRSKQQQLAIWEKADDDTHNIDLVSLKDNQLKSVENTASYYSKEVVPVYLRNVKKAPYSPDNWYKLAKVLVDMNARNDALTAINIGSELDERSEFTDRFGELKSKLSNVN